MSAAPLVDEDEILGPSPHDHDEEAFERASAPCHASYCDYCDEWLTEPHVEPFTMGPTWQRDALGRFVLPKEYREADDPPDTIYTIGHIAVRWIEKWLQLGGEPVRLTAEQIRFIMWWYAIDLNGRWYYRDGTLQRLKGWGKDPLAAMLCLFELCGPARFERWIDRDGLMLPKAREVVDAWVSISGTSKEQTKNTMAMIPQLVTPKLKAKYALEVNKQITYAYGGVRRLEVTSTSPATAEGNRPTFQIGGEPHHWTAATDGIDMQKVMTRNAAKRPAGESRILWVTNAFDPAVESVGRATREAAEVALASGNEARILYDTLEAPPNARLIRREIPVVLEAVRGDAVWLDIPNLTSTILDTRSAPSESRRFYFNQIVADEEAYFPGTAIEATVHETVKAWRRDPDIEFESIGKIGWGLVGPDEDVVMFFDGGKSGDSTAVSARRLSDGYTFTIGHWAKPPRLEDPKHEWVAPVAVVEERIHEAFRRFKIVAFYGDPSHAFDDEGDTPYWVPMLDRLHRAYKGQLRNWPVKTGNRQHSILFDMSNQLNLSKFVPAAMAFREEIREGVITHDGHPMAMNNMRNARQVSTKFGVTIGKRNRQSPQKVDQAVTHAGCKMLADIVLNAEEQSDEVPEVGALWV